MLPTFTKTGSAGKSKSIDFFLIHDVESVRPLFSRSVCRQLLPQALHINRDWVRVGKDRQFRGHLGSGLLPRLNFLLGGKYVEAMRGRDPGFEHLRRA